MEPIRAPTNRRDRQPALQAVIPRITTLLPPPEPGRPGGGVGDPRLRPGDDGRGAQLLAHGAQERHAGERARDQGLERGEEVERRARPGEVALVVAERELVQAYAGDGDGADPGCQCNVSAPARLKSHMTCF